MAIKSYLEIVKKSDILSIDVLENLWDEGIQSLKNNYLNEGYTLEELEPEPYKFSFTDIVRISENFIFHPYSKTCLYEDNVYKIDGSGNMEKLPTYLYEANGTSETFWDGVKQVVGTAKNIAGGAWDILKSFNLIDMLKDPHNILDLLSAVLVGVGVGTSAFTAGLSIPICTSAAFLIDFANIWWYINEIKDEKNPVIRAVGYMSIGLSVTSMTFPIPTPQELAATATKTIKLASNEIFKSLAKPATWLNTVLPTGSFSSERTKSMIKMIAAGGAGYEVFGELLNKGAKFAGLEKEDGEDSNSNIYKWIGCLIGVCVMYKFGRLMYILSKPFKWLLSLGAGTVSHIIKFITEKITWIINWAAKNPTNIIGKIFEKFNLKESLDVVTKFLESNGKPINEVLGGMKGVVANDATNVNPKSVPAIINPLIAADIAEAASKAVKQLPDGDYKKIIIKQGQEDIAKLGDNEAHKLLYMEALAKQIESGKSVHSFQEGLVKQIKDGKTLDELTKNVPITKVGSTTIQKVDKDIEQFLTTDKGKELIKTFQEVELSAASKQKFGISEDLDKLVKSGNLPTDVKDITSYINAISYGELKLPKDVSDEFFNFAIKKYKFKTFQDRFVFSPKEFNKTLFTRKQKNPLVFANVADGKFTSIRPSELKKYKKVYLLTADIFENKIDLLSAKAFFKIVGKLTGLDAATRNKEDAAYAFDPIELGLTDVRGGKIISNDYNLFDKLKDSDIVIDLAYLFRDMNWLLFPFIAKAVQGTLETSNQSQKAMSIPDGLPAFELDMNLINKEGVTFDSIPDSLRNVIKVTKVLLVNVKNDFDITVRNFNIDDAITPAYISALQELIIDIKKKAGGVILQDPVTSYKANLDTIINDLNILGVYLLTQEQLKKQFPDANI
jgi:hypothetical protein